MPRYALWLEPPAREREIIDNAMAALRAAANSGVEFAPHITLFGGFDAEEADAVAMASGLAIPFIKITLTSPGFEDTYYRALYMHAYGGGALTAAHESAGKLRPQSNVPPFMPHLSLLYGDYTHRLKARLFDLCAMVLMDMSFTVDRATLWQIDGPPRDWRRVYP